MPALTPQFVHDLETGMRIVTVNEYQRLAALAGDGWKITVKLPSTLARERLFWLWDTAGIQEVNRLGDEIEYSDLMVETQIFEHKAQTAGLRLNRFKFEDLDGGGVNQATQWSRQIAEYAAYWPRKKIFAAINAGADSASLTYDNLSFFTATTGHPFNPFQVAYGRFDNVFTGSAETNAANGLNPGACPILGVNIATDQASLMRAITFIEGRMVMPNGVDPRVLRVRYLFYPTMMRTAVLQTLGAEFVSGTLDTSSGTSGAQDVKVIKTELARIEPIEVPELGAAFGGSDSTYYLGVEKPAGTDQGALVYFDREAFHVIYHDGMTQSELDRANELEWNGRGRMVVGYGHPYLLYKCPAS